VLYQYFKIAAYSPENVISGIPLSWGRNFMSLTRCTLGEVYCSPTSLVSPQSTRSSHTPEKRERMGRCANVNVPAKAFLQLEIATQSTMRLGSHRSSDVIFGG